MHRCSITLRGVMLCAAFFCLSAAANDGMQFHIVRPASGGTDAGTLTPADVVSSEVLVPERIRNYFKTQKPEFPKALTGKDGSLYVIKAAGDTVTVARGEQGISYGTVVSRHEFNTEEGIFFSPDRSRMAFYRNDESAVAEFPYLDISATNGALKTIRYPMNGCASEKISTGVYDLNTGNVVYLDTEGEFTSGGIAESEFYMTNISWSNDSGKLYVQVLDRSQKNMHLNCYNATDGSKIKTLLTEHSDTWVEPEHQLFWIKGNDRLCVYTTENRDSFVNLYLLDVSTGVIRRLADVDKDMEYVANDGKHVYFTACDTHPVNRYLWRAHITNGKVEQMTKESGWHKVEMSDDCTQFLDSYEALDKAPVFTLRSAKDGKILKTLLNQPDPGDGWSLCEIVMGTVTSANGSDLNYYRMVKPLNFDENRKYPLILYVYGGPHSQMVTNSYLGQLRKWEMLMAQKGYVVFVMDNRGTVGHGEQYEHCIYGECGAKEMEDQMQAIRMLKEIPWIDADRIGVYGWSYGGFLSLSLATGNPDTFKVAVAGGPVIDWKWYEVMYGERYMGRHQFNPEGFAKTSLTGKAGNLKAKTLVIIGAMDDTVVPQHAMTFLQECIDRNVRLDYFTYPKAFHNMKGQDRVHLVDKITEFFEDNL